MRVTITSLYRAGNRKEWIALLACGHKLTVTNAELESGQLFIGKRVTCTTCAAEKESR